MLKKRIIPSLLYKNFGLVKGKQFNSWRRIGTPLPAIKVYNSRDVDELMFLDVMATQDQDEIDFDLIKELTSDCFVPFSVGGGINDILHVQKLLDRGADKVTVNSHAFANPSFLEEIAKKYGSQCVVSSIDYKNIDGKRICFSHSGTVNTNIEVSDWLKIVQDNGAGEVLLTSIDHDGEMNGFDTDFLIEISENVNVPLIVAGGAGCPQDFYEVLKAPNISAVGAASIFQFTEITPNEVKAYLNEHGIPVRI